MGQISYDLRYLRLPCAFRKTTAAVALTTTLVYINPMHASIIIILPSKRRCIAVLTTIMPGA
jgi:hypothetical protein